MYAQLFNAIDFVCFFPFFETNTSNSIKVKVLHSYLVDFIQVRKPKSILCFLNIN